MIKVRNIRALLEINPIAFFYSQGKPKGVTYEALEELERVVNKKFNTGRLKVKVSFIPMPPSELGPALAQGIGDLVAQGVIITRARQEKYAFTTPILTDVKQVIVTGQELANAGRLRRSRRKRHLRQPAVGRLRKPEEDNDERVKAGKTPCR